MTSKMKAGGVFPFVMPADREDESPATFQIRILSAFEDVEVSELRKQFLATKDASERRAIMQKAIDACVTESPEGVAVSELTRHLTFVECWELVNAATVGASLTADDRKKFVSPPSLETDSSVEDAPANA